MPPGITTVSTTTSQSAPTTTKSTTTTTSTTFSTTPTTTTITTTKSSTGAPDTTTVTDTTTTTATTTTINPTTKTTTTTTTETTTTASTSTTTGSLPTTSLNVTATTTTTTQTPTTTTTEKETTTTTTTTKPDGTTTTTSTTTGIEGSSSTAKTSASTTTPLINSTATTSASSTTQIASTDNPSNPNVGGGKNNTAAIAAGGAAGALFFFGMLALAVKRKFRVAAAENPLAPRGEVQLSFENPFQPQTITVTVTDDQLIALGIFEEESKENIKSAAREIATQLLAIGHKIDGEKKDKENFVNNFYVAAALIRGSDEFKKFLRQKANKKQLMMKFSDFRNILHGFFSDKNSGIIGEEFFRNAVNAHNVTETKKLKVADLPIQHSYDLPQDSVTGYSNPRGPVREGDHLYDVPQVQESRIDVVNYGNLSDGELAISPDQEVLEYYTREELQKIAEDVLMNISNGPRQTNQEAQPSTGVDAGVMYETTSKLRAALGEVASGGNRVAKKNQLPEYDSADGFAQGSQYAVVTEVEEPVYELGSAASGGIAMQPLYPTLGDGKIKNDFPKDESAKSAMVFASTRNAQEVLYDVGRDYTQISLKTSEEDERRGINRGADVYSVVDKKSKQKNQTSVDFSSSEQGFYNTPNAGKGVGSIAFKSIEGAEKGSVHDGSAHSSTEGFGFDGEYLQVGESSTDGNPSTNPEEPTGKGAFVAAAVRKI